MSTTNGHALTEAQARVQARLLNTVTRKTAKGQGYNLPVAYNRNWQHALTDAIRRKLVSKNGRGIFLTRAKALPK